MTERLNRVWRIFATGLCFAMFGVGGLLMGAVVFPLVRLVLREPQRRATVAKAAIHHAFKGLVGLMRVTGILSYQVTGLERLRGGGQLVLANHPTLIDVVFLMSFVDRADCIVKAALARNPFTRGPVLAAGFVFNDSGEGLIEDCVNSVHAGNSLIIFPEGTRSPAIGAGRLHRGAARVAIHGQMDITPVRIRCSPPMLGKGVKWYQVPRRRSHFQIDVGEPIPVARFLDGDESNALAARRLTHYLSEYFSTENCRAFT